ncbi:hypothetical protein CXB51_028755 [Gossypium anomalum]|uniref:RNase H type-1 domain-containing protein n=1 Tax=Gossypium anomalum TaxID=47600 RepID=A0A8J6CQL6_9ROSI|nr:hypothetical protein CXB51_028755 [Gossypium anomalum]
MRLLGKKDFEDFITTLRNIWNDRNNATFGGNEEDARVIWERACHLNDDFWIHNFSLQPILPRVPRDFNGKNLLRVLPKAIFIDKVVNPEWAILDALYVGIRLAQSLNLNKVIFEMDCACIVNHLCKHKDDITIFGYRIKDVCEKLNSVSKAKVRWVNQMVISD